MPEMGLIGFGNFGRFMASYLKPHFSLTVYDQQDVSQAAQEAGVAVGTLAEVAAKPIVLFGVPVQYLEEVLREASGWVQPEALVLDVSSVKVRPLELLVRYLPETAEICGTHPLFGPQSGKEGIAGLNLVVCPVRTSRVEAIVNFCRARFGLNVMVRTPEEHDRRMAYVQALTHFIGRALNRMDIPDVAQKTVAYQYLLDIKTNLGGDSWDLFITIEQENPFAGEVRAHFLTELARLHETLG